jgi:uncharacterized lipoprotein YddW (UPF0748 family)
MKKFFSFLPGALALLVVGWLVGSCAAPRSAPPSQVTVPVPRSSLPSPPLPVKEIRGVWVSETGRLDWDRATLALQRAGFNTMYVNLASGGAAFYPRSAVLPSLVRQDDVGRGIQLAHQRGIAVHAKVIAAFMFKAPAEWQRQLVREGRVMRSPTGQVILQNGQAWLCPSQKVNRDLVASTVDEILTRYPVDGVQLDYIRFCEQPSCYCSHCRHEFERWLGKSLKRWPADVMSGVYVSRFNEWKQEVINRWMHQCGEEIRRIRPGANVSVAVFPELNRAREEKAQNWKMWLDRGWVDYVCTMTYSPVLSDFETRIRNQEAVVSRQRLVVGVGSWKLKQINDLGNQIFAVRKHGAAGFALFSLDDCMARNFLPDLNGRK